MTKGTKPQNEWSNSWRKKSQNNDMKELLDQHAQQGKSHHVFLNRDLILQPHRVNGTKRYRLLALGNENRASKQNTAAASPEMPASIRDQPDSPQVAQRGKWVSVNSWSHSFRHLALTPSQESSPNPWDSVSWDTQASESYQETGKHTVFPQEVEDGRQRSAVKKGRKFGTLRI